MLLVSGVVMVMVMVMGMSGVGLGWVVWDMRGWMDVYGRGEGGGKGREGKGRNQGIREQVIEQVTKQARKRTASYSRVAVSEGGIHYSGSTDWIVVRM